MDKFGTKTGSESDLVDPSTPLVVTTIASVSEATTALDYDDEGTHHRKGQSEGEVPVQYRLYKRRWLGIVALVRPPLPVA